MNLELVVYPLVAADVQLVGILAVFECADVWTEITEYMAPMGVVSRVQLERDRTQYTSTTASSASR